MSSGFFKDPFGSIGGTLDHWGNAVGSALGKVGSFIDNNIPGGWAGVGAAALLAAGIYDPELLGMADSGTLTPTALSDAGVSDSAVTTLGTTAGQSTAVNIGAAMEQGASVSQLIDAGVSTSEMVNAGVSASELMNAGVSTSELLNAGASAGE